MKRAYFIFAVFLMSGIVSAQEKIDKKCKELQRAVDSLVLKNEYDKAYSSWSGLRKTCATFSDRVYTSGADLLRIRIDQAAAEDKEANVKELLKLYDDFAKNIPSTTEPVLMRKALLLEQYKLGTNAEIYELLDRAFAKNPDRFTDHKAIFLYLQLYVEKYKAGDKTITSSKILRKRDDLTAHLERLSSKPQDNARTTQALQQVVKDIASCENLDAYYSESYEKRKTDTLWVAVALQSLSDSYCRESKMFMELTNYQQQVKPTAQSAYNLGSAAYQKAKFDEAAKYFIQSAELATDPQQKADTYFTLATTVYALSDKAKQKEYLDKAIEVKSDYSKAYVQLAQMYGAAGADCGKNAFEKKALNWLAAQTLRKAMSVDKSKGGLEKLVRKYEEKAPSDKEIKDARMGGMTIYYDCWIRNSVVVPKK